MQRAHSRTNGFTLIELSMVLVIIALIVGGVLVGKELIKASELRAMATEAEQLEIAMQTFKLKYNCLPGDCTNGSTLFSGTNDGNGNDLIDTFASNENFYGLAQMHHAGLITGMSNPGGIVGVASGYANGTAIAIPGYNVPKSKYRDVGYMPFGLRGNSWACPIDTIGGAVWPPDTCFRHMIVFSRGSDGNDPDRVWGFSGLMYFQPAIPCADIMSLDNKVDDGRPFGGRLQLPVINAGCYLLPNGDVPGGYKAGIYLSDSATLTNIMFITAF